MSRAHALPVVFVWRGATASRRGRAWPQLAQGGGDAVAQADLRNQVAIWTTPTSEANYSGTIDAEYLLVYRVLAGLVDHPTVTAKGTPSRVQRSAFEAPQRLTVT